MHKTVFIAFFFLLVTCCQQKEIRRPGICLSFDDRTVREWYSMKELLKEYNSHVTFFVTQFDSLDSVEVRMLKELQQEGHEIGSHGALHLLSESFIKENSYKEYIKKEIDASILAMKRNGFIPKSFAYPYGAKYWFTDMILLRKFDVLRGVERINTEKDLSLIDNIYYSFDGDRTLSAVGIDQYSGLTKDMIQKAIKRACDNKELLMLYGHSPITNTDNGPYNFDVDLLEFILVEAKKNNLEHFSFSELASD
jgi:peptidoglycan-N-acetylglucosamine deacetylase